MTITFPVSLPSSSTPSRVMFEGVSVVGVARSPFTGTQQVYAHQGEWFEATVEYPPLERAEAEELVAFLLSLNGREGTFLLGDPSQSAPLGTWAGTTPLVAGGTQTGKNLVVDGLAQGLTALRGDWLQLGSGSSARLHKVVVDATVSGSPLDLRLDIWPRLRSSPTDNDSVVLASPKGLFRLKDNRRAWSIGDARLYGIQFSCVEALSA